MITAMPRIAIAVHDYAAAVAMFRDVFGMPVADFSPQTVPSLGAHVGMCQPPGGSNIELMAVADPNAALSRSLAGFLDRRGEGLFALMLEAPDPNAEADELAARGLGVLPLMPGATGRDVHPRSTHGVLVRVYPDGSVAQPATPSAGPLGLSGIVRVIIATADAEAAAKVWGHGFGLRVDEPVVDEDDGVRIVRCRPPAGGVIDLVSVVDVHRPFADEIGRFVAERGEGMYALVLEADDPGDAASHLVAGGLDLVAGSPPELMVFGTRIVLVPRAR